MTPEEIEKVVRFVRNCLRQAESVVDYSANQACDHVPFAGMIYPVAGPHCRITIDYTVPVPVADEQLRKMIARG